MKKPEIILSMESEIKHEHNHAEGKMDILGSWLFDQRVNVVLPRLSGNLLDIGCGTNKLVKKHGDGVGVDVYQFGGADLIVEDTSKLPFEDGKFASVAILAALNHIHNRHDVLKEVHRVLAPSGKIFVTMIPPIISLIWHALRKPWDRDQQERGMHEHEVFGFTKKEMRAMLSAGGFDVVEEVPFMLGINRLYVGVKKR